MEELFTVQARCGAVLGNVSVLCCAENTVDEVIDRMLRSQGVSTSTPDVVSLRAGVVMVLSGYLGYAAFFRCTALLMAGTPCLVHRVLCHISCSSFCLCLQSVTYRGRPCGAQSTLGDLGAGSGSRLDVVLRLRGGGGDGGATGAESRISYLEMYASKKPDKVCPLMSSFLKPFCERSDSQHAGSEISSCHQMLLVHCFLGPANCTSQMHREGKLR